MSEVLKVEFRKFASQIAEGEIRRDLAPLNFENLKKVGKAITTAINRGEYIILNIPAKLTNEGSLYSEFKEGDLLLAPAASSLIVVLRPFSEARFRMYKAGEVKTGMNALRLLKTGESVTVVITEATQHV
ncbi:hypothetical protein [Infirmifilum sp. SLHALR2]|nr:MAG: hypothetical protein B7L53_05185 [Thermofilum sp. NZ13]